MRYKGEKGKAWEAVKRWCRQTYYGCYTCPAVDLVSYNANAGHYQPVGIVGSNNKLAWDENFIRMQCGACNGVGQGMQVIFRENLVKEHGEKMVAEYDRQVAGKFYNAIKDWNAIREHFDTL